VAGIAYAHREGVPDMRRLLAIVLATLPTAAFAAPGWTEPTPIDFFGNIPPAVGFADGAVEFVAHVEAEGTADDVQSRLIVTRRGPGETEATEELRITSTTTAVPAAVTMAVAPSGAAVIAFAERTSNDLSPLPPLRWRAAYRTAEGVWETPTTLFTDLEAIAPGVIPDETPHCAIAPDGTAVAGASHLEVDDPSEPAPGQTDSRLDLSLRPAGGTWQLPQRISGINDSTTMAELHADDEANFSIIWRKRYSEGASDNSGDDRGTILVRRLLAGTEAWTVTENITEADPNDSVNAGPQDVAVSPSGRAVVAFQKDEDLETWAAVRDSRTGQFGSPVLIAGVSSFPVGAGVAPDDTAYVVYQLIGGVPGQDHVGLVRRPSGGSWTDEYPVSPFDFDLRTAAVGFVDSDALVVWTGTDTDSRPVVQALRWAADAGLPETFQELDERPETVNIESVQSDRAGSVVAVWEDGDTRVRAVFDAGPPALLSRTIPQAAIIVGSPASFAASFLDAWSPLAGEPAWSFGDGTADTTGGSVTHTYALPGLYTASVTSADAFGNATTSSFSVTVGACESLAGVEGVSCRCTSGLALGVSECSGATVPEAVARKFDAACQAVAAAQGATSAKKGRKAAGKAAKTFKKAGKVLAGKKGKALTDACRDELAGLLGIAKDRATALKDAL
jgi:hypothetical protein